MNRHVVGDERALQKRRTANPSWLRVLQGTSRGGTCDLVVGFQNRADAERLLTEFQDQLVRFGLVELHPDKARLIEFRRFAAEPETNRVPLVAARTHARSRDQRKRLPPWLRCYQITLPGTPFGPGGSPAAAFRPRCV